MTTDIKVFLVVCGVIVCILAAAIVYLVKPKDIASVQNNKVTNDEFKYYYAQNIQYLSMYAGTGMDQATLVEYGKQIALSQAVEVEYLLQEAKEAGFKVDQKELNDGWAEMEKNINEGASANSLSVSEFCEQVFGVKQLSQLKSIYNDSFTAQKYKESMVDAVPVDEEKLAAYYEENKASFDVNTVRHILVAYEEGAEESVIQEKKKAAEDILVRVNNGDDFAELAKEFSEDPGSKDTGGVYQVQQNGQYVPEFEEWAFSHKVGETGIVETDYGFHVMRMENISDSLDSQREVITASYKNQQIQTQISEAMNNGDIKIEILDGYEKFQF